MPWKCPNCGYENADARRECQGLCGFVCIPSAVALRAAATDRRLTFSIDTAVGKYLLRSIAEEDAIYASEPQFRIYKDAALGAWALQHARDAKNPTYCDGVALNDEPAALHEGSTVSIGPERLKLTVHLVE